MRGRREAGGWVGNGAEREDKRRSLRDRDGVRKRERGREGGRAILDKDRCYDSAKVCAQMAIGANVWKARTGLM